MARRYSGADDLRVSRQLGYLVAAALNVGFFAAARELLDWEWPPFLTEDWQDVLDVLEVALVAGAAVNLVWMLYDPAWLRNLGRGTLDVLGIVVGVRLWDVFPFDFSDYSFDWETATRAAIGIAVVALFADAVLNLARLVGVTRRQTPRVEDGHVPAG